MCCQSGIALSDLVKLPEANDGSISSELSPAVRWPYLKVGMKYLYVVVMGTTILKEDINLVDDAGGELHIELVGGFLC